MLTIDANIWVAAYDPRDRFHEASMAFLRAVSQRELALNGPAFVILETACALTLISWDDTLIRRADSITPRSWLSKNP